MRFRSFIWDHQNISHIASHQVIPQEAEEACYNKPLVLKSRSERYYVLGTTDSGRYLTVIIEPRNNSRIYVITARDMSESERYRFQRR